MSDPEENWIRKTAAGVSIDVYITPRASANKVVGVYGGALKVMLTAPPVNGAANKALAAFLAKLLGVPKSDVTLLSGQASRSKVVEITGLSREDILRSIGHPGGEESE